MADISNIADLQPVEQLNLSNYKSAVGGFQLPKAGIYTVQAPANFPTTAWSRAGSGALQAQIDPTIVGPTNEGFTVRFTKVSAKTFDRSGTIVSYMGDYLLANGYQGEVPGDPQTLANLVEATAGRTYQVELDWEARHRPTNFSVKGMRNFPKNKETGEYQSWIEHPTEKDADGAPLRLRANVVVRRYLPATS